MRCSYCDRDNPEGNEFCGHCGVNIGCSHDEVRYDQTFWAIMIVGTVLIILASFTMSPDPIIGLASMIVIFLVMLLLLAYLRRIMDHFKEKRS